MDRAWSSDHSSSYSGLYSAAVIHCQSMIQPSVSFMKEALRSSPTLFLAFPEKLLTTCRLPPIISLISLYRASSFSWLHVLKGTDLYTDYLEQSFQTLTLDEYTDILIRCIELMPPEMVIHRITGDGPKNILAAPDWSRNKKQVLNHIHHCMKIRNTWQGRCYLQ